MRNNTPVILIFHAILIILVQLLILNNILIFNKVHPYLYLLVILFLPVGLNKITILIIGFLTGLAIDIFSISYGIHTIASTLIAFLRPFILSGITDIDEESKNALPGIRFLGIQSYLTYLLIIIFIHHLTMYMLDAGGFRDFFYTIFKSFFSTFVSALVIIIYELALLFKLSEPR